MVIMKNSRIKYQISFIYTTSRIIKNNIIHTFCLTLLNVTSLFIYYISKYQIGNIAFKQNDGWDSFTKNILSNVK